MHVFFPNILEHVDLNDNEVKVYWSYIDQHCNCMVFTAAPACTGLSAKIRDSINIIAHRIDPIPHMMCWTIQCIDLYIFKLSD